MARLLPEQACHNQRDHSRIRNTPHGFNSLSPFPCFSITHPIHKLPHLPHQPALISQRRKKHPRTQPNHFHDRNPSPPFHSFQPTHKTHLSNTPSTFKLCSIPPSYFRQPSKQIMGMPLLFRLPRPFSSRFHTCLIIDHQSTNHVTWRSNGW